MPQQSVPLRPTNNGGPASTLTSARPAPEPSQRLRISSTSDPGAGQVQSIEPEPALSSGGSKTAVPLEGKLTTVSLMIVGNASVLYWMSVVSMLARPPRV